MYYLCVCANVCSVFKLNLPTPIMGMCESASVQTCTSCHSAFAYLQARLPVHARDVALSPPLSVSPLFLSLSPALSLSVLHVHARNDALSPLFLSPPLSLSLCTHKRERVISERERGRWRESYISFTFKSNYSVGTSIFLQSF